MSAAEWWDSSRGDDVVYDADLRASQSAFRVLDTH